MIGASKIARDISDRIEGAVTAAPPAAVVESSDDAIISKNLDSIITSWNPAAERMFGYTEAEAIGKSIRMLIPDDLQGEEDTVLAKIRAGETVDHYETIRQRKDGTADRDLADRVADPRRRRRRRRRLEDRPRHHRARARCRPRRGEHAANTAEARRGRRDRSPRRSIAKPIVQKVTDTATELTHAEFGAFFYNVRDPKSGDAYMLYTLSGAPQGSVREVSASARHRDLRADLQAAKASVRLDDVTKDPRYGKNPPYHGMPAGHLPVRSYLAVPVKGIERRRARRAVLRPLAGRRVHRAARAARRRHRGVGARWRSRTRGSTPKRRTPTA